MNAEMQVPDLIAIHADRWVRVVAIGFTEVVLALLLPVFALLTGLTKASDLVRGNRHRRAEL